MPHLSCMNFVGLELAIVIVLIGSKLCLGKGLLKNYATKSKFGTFYVVLRFGPYEFGTMTKCSNMNNGVSLR